MWLSDDCRVGLAFRRLAIIDLSDSAMQPMANEDGSIRIVFNGEIYNHAEIRAELEAARRPPLAHGPLRHRGHRPRLRAVGHRMPRSLPRHVRTRDLGRRTRELWLVRDRIGIKPLYYSVHHGRLSFASEIKALLADPEQARAVDEDVALPLPVVPHDARARTPCSRASRSCPAGRGCGSRADGTIHEQR